MTYQAVFVSGWKATLKDDTMAAARKRFATMGRGERCTVKLVADSTFRIYEPNDTEEENDDE